MISDRGYIRLCGIIDYNVRIYKNIDSGYITELEFFNVILFYSKMFYRLAA